MTAERDNVEINHEKLDELRRGRGPIPEHVLDEFIGGRLSRRDFLRKGTMVGLSFPFLGSVLKAMGDESPIHGTARPGATSGATIRAGILTPTGAINPLTIDDEGGLELLGNIGEYLVLANDQLQYKPWLATSWSPNADGTVWTFKIRQGVKFNNGTPMTIDDVVYSFQSQSEKKNGSNALSVFAGTLTPAGVVKVDDETIAFHLEAADGAFPDAVSSDNYNMIMVPKGYDYTKFQTEFVGTGHFKVTSYTANVGAVFARSPYYWGAAALPSEVQWTFYPTETPMVAALEAGAIDTLDQFSVANSPQLLVGNKYNIINLRSSLHREISMRTDIHPFTSKYVRQAIALTLDRPSMVASLFKGKAVVGNDSPFAPIFPTTVGPPAVPQRVQNLKLAKELLAKGGVPRWLFDPIRRRQPSRRAGTRPDHQSLGGEDRSRHLAHDREPDEVLRLRCVWELGLARRRNEHGRLWRAFGAECLFGSSAAVVRESDRSGPLERSPLQQHGVRHLVKRVRRRCRPQHPAQAGQKDRTALAR